MSVTKASLNKVGKETEELLKLLGLKMKCSVSADLNGVKVDLSGKDGALLIGYHGENLGAFAYVLGLILRKKVSEDLIFRIDVNGYLKDKDRKISEIVMRAVEKVRKTNFPEEIGGFNAYERRLAHTIVAKEGLKSESRGLGEKRILVIRPMEFDEKGS
jgi:spoIIIJ-associated protein